MEAIKEGIYTGRCQEPGARLRDHRGCQGGKGPRWDGESILPGLWHPTTGTSTLCSLSPPHTPMAHQDTPKSGLGVRAGLGGLSRAAQVGAAIT